VRAARAAAGLGPGAVYCEALHPLFAEHPDLIQVAEIEPSSFWVKGPGPKGVIRSNALAMERIAALPQAKLVHGIGFPIGGSDCEHGASAAELRRWAERLDAPWTSEHLSFNASRAGPAGFLLPPEQSEAGVATATRNIRARAKALGGIPFAFETGVNYLAPRLGEIPDGAFFAQVAESADCLILLDLHNLWANERNGRQRVKDVVAALPAERVCEIHLAGGLETDGYWLDAHSGQVPPALMDLAADLLGALPNVGAILFEVAPQFVAGMEPASFLRQIEGLHRLWERVPRRPVGRGRSRANGGNGDCPCDYEEALVKALASPPGAGEERGIALYRTLISSFRNGALADLLPHTLRLLALHLGTAGLEALLAAYRSAAPPPLFPADEAIGFAAWIAGGGPDLPYLDDLLALEAGVVRIVSEGAGGELRFRHDPSLILAALEEGRAPVELATGDFRLTLGGGPGAAGTGAEPAA
jgi:uncharacterized protein (UPF0276 family)